MIPPRIDSPMMAPVGNPPPPEVEEGEGVGVDPWPGIVDGVKVALAIGARVVVAKGEGDGVGSGEAVGVGDTVGVAVGDGVGVTPLIAMGPASETPLPRTWTSRASWPEVI
mmetsp:Transcript_3911/g.7516  ORF Transcript_3911/g.7516 Transcript_3911/m.7516 type:complete len:111 (+) Transcript_3911:4185-4517(+)